MRATCVPICDTYWTERGIQVFEQMFGRKPFTTPEFDDLSEERALALLREELQKATVHFGEGNLNPSTIASVFALIEERVTAAAG
jgi:hypothetical protein